MESENVKERLTSMLHKKLSDLQDRESKQTEISECIKQEDEERNSFPETAESRSSEETKNVAVVPEDFVTLQEILDEKKKALLHNKDVIKFLQSKK